MARISLTRHWKFRRLARALGSPALARGILELLWEAAYEVADPYVGEAEDIADAVSWRESPALLIDLLIGCGFLEPAAEPGAYAVHDLWQHAPDYVRKRWVREHPQVKDGAWPWQKARSAICQNRTTRPASTQPASESSGAAPPPPSRQEPTEADEAPPQRVLNRLAWELPQGLPDEADRKDELKRLAAQYRLRYDATSITQALDAQAHARPAPAWARQPRREAELRRRRRRQA